MGGEVKVQESKRNDVDKLRNYCASLANAAIAVAFDFPQLNSISFTIKFAGIIIIIIGLAQRPSDSELNLETGDSNSNSLFGTQFN